jgi:hypothetical protein
MNFCMANMQFNKEIEGKKNKRSTISGQITIHALP